MPPNTYGQAQDQARALINEARLNDPDEHFPYKHDTVMALIDEDPPMGPGIPGGADGADDRSRSVADYITADIADASRGYIEAQAVYLADPSNDNLDVYNAARDQLVAARLDHRRNRGEGFTVGAAARKAG